MPAKITRRDILKFTGGGILGVMLSPLPWKLLDDSSIWTQNWSLTPKLSHGPITAAFSHCTLCNAGCAIKAQCVSGIPYYLTGIQDHPITHGVICPRGIGGHHMAHHPLRIVHPHKFAGKSETGRMVAVSLQEALDDIAQKMTHANGSLAIFDQQPNRVISEIYRNFLEQTGKGIYLSSPSREDATIISLQEMMNLPAQQFGFDFENTKLILSFGAPLLDGWGIPGQMTHLRNKRAAKIIQIDSNYSRTSMQADEWIAVKSGTEKILALSIANVLVDENLIPKHIQSLIHDFTEFKKIVKNFTPEQTVARTDVEPDIVKKVSRELVKAESAIILSGADPGGGPFDHESEKAIALLNVLTGNVGRKGGIISHRAIPGYNNTAKQTRWSEIPDHSISVLIVDGSDSGYAIPWSLVNRKLDPSGNLVVSLSSVLNEISAHSDYLIPSPAHYESICDVPTQSGNSTAAFALSSPLLKKQEGTIEPSDVIKSIARRINIRMDIPEYEEILKQKVAAIFEQRRGSLFAYSSKKTIALSDIPSSDELWAALIEGAVWIDEPAKQLLIKKITFALHSPEPPVSDHNELLLVFTGWRGATSTPQISPLLSKVFQESELRNVNGIVTVHPETAGKLGCTSGMPAIVSTKSGSLEVRIKISTAVRPGVLEASVAPLPNGIETPAHPLVDNILNLCEVTNDGTWRVTTANLLKV